MKHPQIFDLQAVPDLDHHLMGGAVTQQRHPDISIQTRRALVDELMPRYQGVASRQDVEDVVTAAICDLQGSICLEALPEMATRLAIFRLDRG